MPHKHLGTGAQIKIHSPKSDVEMSTLAGGVWSIYKWHLYTAAHWLCSRIRKPAGNAERRAGPSVFPGDLRVQHPAAGSAHSQLHSDPASTALNLSLMFHLKTTAKTSKESTKRSLLHSNRAPKHTSKKYESFLILFFSLVLFKYVPHPIALSQKFGVKCTPLLKSNTQVSHRLTTLAKKPP